MSAYLFLPWLAVIFSYADLFSEEINQHAEEGDLFTNGPQHCTSCPRLPRQGEQIQYVLRMLKVPMHLSLMSALSFCGEVSFLTYL